MIAKPKFGLNLETPASWVAQVEALGLNALLSDLKRERDMSMLLITHDIGVVAEVADRVVVMQGGRVVEHGPWEQVIRAPREAYTKALIGAHMSLEEALTEGGLHGCSFAWLA